MLSSRVASVRWPTWVKHDTTADRAVVSEKMAAGMEAIQNGKLQTCTMAKEDTQTETENS